MKNPVIVCHKAMRKHSNHVEWSVRRRPKHDLSKSVVSNHGTADFRFIPAPTQLNQMIDLLL